MEEIFDAIENNDFPKLKELLEKGADPNIQNQCGKTPLHLLKNIKQTKLLLESGANPNIQNINGDTPLHLIMNVEQIKLLLEKGASPRCKERTERNKVPSLDLRLRGVPSRL